MLGHDKKITVNKEKLLEKLKGNLVMHVEEYHAAKKAFRAAAIDEMEKQLGKARAGEKFNLSFRRLLRPRNHDTEYNMAIGMLEMEVADTVTITAQDYDRFVLDNWDWKEDFSNTNRSYGIGRAVGGEEEEID